MLDKAEDFLGRVTFVTGPEKHCGKTTFMNRAAEIARRGARAAGLPGPALLTVGYDGEARDFLSGARKPALRPTLLPGDPRRPARLHRARPPMRRAGAPGGDRIPRRAGRELAGRLGDP